MPEALLDELDMVDKVTWVMKKRGLSYESIIDDVNRNMPEGVTAVKTRQEISRALNHGYSKGNRGRKNNAIINAVLKTLGI